MAFPEGKLIATNGIELEVFEAGAPGKPIVLCHGWPEHAFSWRHQIDPLVAAGYHVIVPNQRGYGASSRPEDVAAYDITHLTDDTHDRVVRQPSERTQHFGEELGALADDRLELL